MTDSIADHIPRVLVVDDEPKNRRLLEIMLATEGVLITCAASGPEALAQIEREAPDLILLDVMMPGMDGYAVAAAIKGNLATKTIPIIMVTVRDDREARMCGLQAGAEDFLSKPVDRAELCVRVRNLLRLKAFSDYHDKYGQLLEEEVASRTADLVKTEARYRRIVETTGEGIWQIDATGSTTFVNARMAEMLGCSVEAILGRSPAEFLYAEGMRALVENLQPMRDGIRTPPVELRFKRTDGTSLWALVETSPIRSPDGNFSGVLGMAMDITARKAADEARRYAEERRAAVVNAAFDAVVVMDPDGSITEINPAAERMFGYSTHAIIGYTLDDLVVPPRARRDHEAALVNYLDDGADPGSGVRRELVAMRRDGGTFPAELSISRVTSKMRSSFVGFIRDISDRKRAEQTLLERVHVANLGAAVGVALTRVEPLGEILQRCATAILENLDAVAARIWVVTATKQLELLGWTGTVTDVEQNARKFDIDQIVRDRVPYSTNTVPNDPRLIDFAWASRERVQSFAAFPLIVEGELVGVLTMFARDPLSEVVIDGLGAIADTIAIRIRGKLAEQANKGLEEQLRQSQKMEAVGRLAGGVAHDFNNLLSVVLSYADFAIEDLAVGDPLRADMEEIRQAGLRAADLTRQLLMFSRQQVVKPAVLNLNEVLAGMDKMLRRILGEDVTLTTVVSPSLGCVRADPGSIEQVIMNLVINARDAMPTGGQITMETANVVLDDHFVTTHLGVAAGPHVMVSVTDTGCGMDKATVARIFEPFFTTKESGKGTGLGLSTVFGITQQSGGTVWVYSEPGIGTTFKVYLPQVDGVVDSIRPARDTLFGRGTETILLVEDEDQVRDVARETLRRYGYTVLEARSGGEAILLCERHPTPIDLLLSDVVMPGMSGPELAKRLARGHPEMRVLCMSGYTDDAAVRHGVIDAHFAYLQKPLTVETLTRRVREVLDTA